MSRAIVFVGLCLCALAVGAQQGGRRSSDAGPPRTPVSQAQEQQMPHAQMQHSQAEHVAQMGQMQARMAAMHEQMARIQATADPAERQRLMSEHMLSMREGMSMMGEMMHGGMAPDTAPACPAGDTDCRMERLQMRQNMMNEQMAMMQQMMQQLVEQQQMMQEHLPETGGAR